MALRFAFGTLLIRMYPFGSLPPGAFQALSVQRLGHPIAREHSRVAPVDCAYGNSAEASNFRTWFTTTLTGLEPLLGNPEAL
mmetsp:Transcript_111939/g.203437  ORF Transcript_111939/g.203437 Transcript_111939/m.203437 type:complete len:82 (+) Transcript_111939:501-746(+)